MNGVGLLLVFFLAGAAVSLWFSIMLRIDAPKDTILATWYCLKCEARGTTWIKGCGNVYVTCQCGHDMIVESIEGKGVVS